MSGDATNVVIEIAAPNSQKIMKTNSILKRLSSVAAPMVALMIGGTAAPTLAAPFDSPVGDWDFSFTGSEKGVAQITFLGDYTLTGFEILMPGKPRKDSSADSNPRGGPSTDVDPRTGVPDGGTGTNILSWGGVLIDGFWGFDEKGKVVGVVTYTSSSSTNGMNFIGTVVAGTRMTLRASDDSGGMTYRGVPRVALPDISGDYTASGKKGRSRFNTIFSLTASSSPNIYDVVTHGPGYDGTGIALLTSNSKLGIYYEIGNTNPAIVALSGSFNSSRLKGSVTGTDGTNNLSLKVVMPQP